MQYITSNDFPQIAYRKTGNGPVIILVHGFPGDGDMWRMVVSHLSAAYTVLTPDLPGAGESASAGEGLTVEVMAACAKEILDKEQIAKAVIAGHSMGGYVGIAFAANYPDRLQGLSMVHSTAVDDDNEKKETRRKAVSLIQSGAKDAFIKQMVPNLFAPGFNLSDPAIVERQIEDALKLSPESMIAFYNAMLNRPGRVNILQDIHFPMQWIIGEKDNVLPFTKSLQQSHLSNLNFVSVYEDCGHMSMLERPEKLSADLDMFLTYCYNH
jgi:pimeloyl-ACP methyl ester carboxylesterase